MRGRDLSHISLFTGAGGLDLGIERAGFTTLVAIEKDKHAQVTLDSNREHFQYPSFPLLDDVNEVTGEDLLAAAGVRFGDLDLLSGGPPCQTFSTAGHRLSMADPRGSLFGRFLEIVGEVQPRFFVLENVRGVLSAALRHRPLAERVEGYPPLEPDEELGSLLKLVVLPRITEDLGYQVAYGLINAADYGVPQVRQRVVFIGSREHELGGELVNSCLGELIQATHSEEGGAGLPGWETSAPPLTVFPRERPKGRGTARRGQQSWRTSHRGRTGASFGITLVMSTCGQSWAGHTSRPEGRGGSGVG